MKGCDVEGCRNPHSARGLCGTHYSMWYQSEDFFYKPPAPIFCICPDPITTGIGECRSCHRKPRALMDV